MNKPKTIKRASRLKDTFDSSDMFFVGAMTIPEYCIAFAEVVTDFVFLEERMATVLASLMGASDPVAANYVLQSISSPTARYKVMKKLLEDAKLNEEKDRIYDQILEDFKNISDQRNGYVHGRWWTSAAGEVVLDNTLDPNEPFQNARSVPIEEIRGLASRVTSLQETIGNHVDIIYFHGKFERPEGF